MICKEFFHYAISMRYHSGIMSNDHGLCFLRYMSIGNNIIYLALQKSPAMRVHCGTHSPIGQCGIVDYSL